MRLHCRRTYDWNLEAMSFEQALTEYLTQEGISGAFDPRFSEASVGFSIEYRVPQAKWTLFHQASSHKLMKFLFEYGTIANSTEGEVSD